MLFPKKEAGDSRKKQAARGVIVIETNRAEKKLEISSFSAMRRSPLILLGSPRSPMNDERREKK